MANLPLSPLFGLPKRPVGLAITAALACGPLFAQAQTVAAINAETPPSYSMGQLDLTGMSAAGATGSDQQTLYLEVYRGDQATGLIAHLRQIDGRLYATPEELLELGVVAPATMPLDEQGMVPLDSLPGLVYRYQVAEQRLQLIVPVALRVKQQLGYRAPSAVHATRGNGLLFNYDAYARSLDNQNSLAIATQLRWFGRAGRLEMTGISRFGVDADSYERLDTSWTYSDPDRLWTWTAGDLITSSLPWTRSVRLGGLQWRRNFAVRPELITFPIPRFSGSATVPSGVELLVNNIQQFGGEVNDGPFVIDSFPRVSGAGVATLVVHDALGRTTQTSVPIYVDAERLAPGLTDFSVEAGMLRLGYGDGQNEYGSDLVMSGNWRRGLTDDFTVELHGETGGDVHLAGLGAVWSPAGHWGLIAGSITQGLGSSGGNQISLGYQYTTPRYGMDLQTQRLSADYRDISSLAVTTPSIINDSLRELDRATFFTTLPRGSLALTWLRFRQNDGTQDRISSFTWTQTFGEALSMQASVFASSSGNGAGINFSLPLGHNRDVSVSFDHSDGRTETLASLQQNGDYDGGWGWQVQAGDRPGGYLQASANTRGRLGDISFGFDRIAERTGYFFQGAGSLILMDGQTFVSRRVNDAFAVVSSDGIAELPVLYENRVYGQTNAKGYLLLPDLHGWQRNRIAINPDSLGANYRLSDLEQQVTPADNGAVLVSFKITPLHPVMATLLDAAGAPVVAGTRGKLLGSEETFLVGFDGEAYLENLPSDSVLELNAAGTVCRYRVSPPTGVSETTIPRIGPLSCERSTP